MKTINQAAVALVINLEGKVLAVRRKTGNKIGKWGLPGGKVEIPDNLDESQVTGITLRQTAVRELKEETGYLGSIHYYTPLLSELEDGFTTTAFLVDWYREEAALKLDNEAEHGWIHQSVLTGPEGAYPEYNKKVLDNYYSQFSKLTSGYYYYLKSAGQAIKILQTIGVCDYGTTRIWSDADNGEEYTLVLSVYSIKPLMLKRNQIAEMEPVQINSGEYYQYLKQAQEERSYIGKENLSGNELIMAAKAFAFECHNNVGQLYGNKLYSCHLMDVAYFADKYRSLATNAYIAIAAALCHDTIEDTGVTYNDAVKALGKEVADLIFALSNFRGKTRDERAPYEYYEGLLCILDGEFVKLCDRFANVSNAGSMVKKYKKEMPKFMDGLGAEDSDLQEMWNDLKALLMP